MILLGKIALSCAATVTAGAGLLCSEGFVNVKVIQNRPDAPHIHVIAPAPIVPIVARLVPQARIAKAADKIEPWLPTIRAALDGLSDSPDLTLVDVSGPDEHVHVAKEGASIVVDVTNPEASVHVSVPLTAIDSTVSAVAADAGPRSDDWFGRDSGT
jgi:hypothetical protein